MPVSRGKVNSPTLCESLYAPKDLLPFAPNSASISENASELPDDFIAVSYNFAKLIH